MKYYYIFWLFFIGYFGNSQESYIEYHKSIAEAETEILLHENIEFGFSIIDTLFSTYEFVFIDDCIEFFQLALYQNETQRAFLYLQKAIENGFRIEHLKKLNCGSPHNYYKDIHKGVALVDDFVEKHIDTLMLIEQDSEAQYLSRLDTNLIQALIIRHTKEQLYKNYQPSLGISKSESNHLYKQTSKENLSFIETLTRQGIFIGEKNLGHFDLYQYRKIGIDYLETLSAFPADIPVITEEEYFQINFTFTILFHNPCSYQSSESFALTAIDQGYLHPREYAYLMRSSDDDSKKASYKQLRLGNYFTLIEDTTEINERRAYYFLPPYEVDFAKHELSQRECLKLNFGFFNSSK